MAVIFYFLYVFIDIWLFFRMWKLRRTSENRNAGSLILQIVLFTLIFDSFVVGMGRWLGEGDLLIGLTQGRFLLRAVFLPFLAVTALYMASRAEVQWAAKKLSRLIIWVAAVSFMGFGLLADFLLPSDLAPEVFWGTLHYVRLNRFPPVPFLVILVVMMILGILIWRRIKWPWIFLGGLVTFLGILIPTALIGPVVRSGAEVFLMGTLVATEHKLLAPNYSLSETELDSRISRVSAGRKK